MIGQCRLSISFNPRLESIISLNNNNNNRILNTLRLSINDIKYIHHKFHVPNTEVAYSIDILSYYLVSSEDQQNQLILLNNMKHLDFKKIEEYILTEINGSNNNENNYLISMSKIKQMFETFHIQYNSNILQTIYSVCGDESDDENIKIIIFLAFITNMNENEKVIDVYIYILIIFRV